MPSTISDPQSGRLVVAIAGALGLVAVVGYTSSATRARAPVFAPERTTAASLGDLLERSAKARASADPAAMARSIEELQAFEKSTALANKAHAAKLEIVDLWAAVALEASIRAQLDPPTAEASHRAAAAAITKVRDLADDFSDKDVDRARLDAALARAELAAGTDITESHAMVLLPSYRDQELRAAAISAPLWRGPAADDALADGIVAQLRAIEPPTALVRVLVAQGLLRSGGADSARAVLDQVLTTSPSQPIALAMRRSLGGGPLVVAMGGTDRPAEPVAVEPVPVEPVAVEPAVVAPPPVAEPDDEPVVEPVEPVATPVAKPTPTPKPTPATKPATPKPATPKPAKPDDGGSKKRTYDSLLSEGCKLVRSGNAEAGFEVLKEAFDLNPTAVAVTVCMAEAHQALGRTASARALCDRALRKSPYDRRALLLAAELDIAAGDQSGALGHYRKILEKNPDDAKAKAYVESHGG